jgi:carboxylesterase type B
VVAAELAGRLGVAPTLEGFAAVPVDRLVAAQSELSADIALHPDPGRWREITANLMPFEPVVDGQILPARPVDGVAAWNGRAADLLVGTNRNEHRLFVVPTGVADVANDATLQMAAGTLGLDASGLDAYRADGAGAGDVLAEVLTDWFYRIPAIRLAEAHQGESYMYEFGGIRRRPASGSARAMDWRSASCSTPSTAAWDGRRGPEGAEVCSHERHRCPPGHCCPDYAVGLAQAAGGRRVRLFHHAPGAPTVNWTS